MGRKLSEERIAEKLKKKKKPLAVAESCTGGLVSSRITDMPGSSGYFLGGVVTYSNEAKKNLLGVPPGLIEKHGAVSREVSIRMARGARKVFKSDIAVSVTGIAGPSGGTKQKPVGLAYISFASGRDRKVRKVFFKGTRRVIKKKFSDAVLELIEKNI